MYFHFLILYNGLERIRIKTMTSHDRFHGHAITLNFEANRVSQKNSGNKADSLYLDPSRTRYEFNSFLYIPAKDLDQQVK